MSDIVDVNFDFDSIGTVAVELGEKLNTIQMFLSMLMVSYRDIDKSIDFLPDEVLSILYEMKGMEYSEQIKPALLEKMKEDFRTSFAGALQEFNNECKNAIRITISELLMINTRIQVLDDKKATIDNAHRVIDELRALYRLKQNREENLAEYKKSIKYWSLDNFDLDTLKEKKSIEEIVEEEKGEE